MSRDGWGTLDDVTAVAHFPTTLDHGPLERLRRPLAGVAVLILVLDFIGLGLNLADSAESPFANDAPAGPRARVVNPDAVVPDTAVPTRAPTSRTRAAQPLGCLASASECFIGPPAPTPTGPGAAGPPATPPPAEPVPVVQAALRVPALSTQASLGLGDGSCTGLDLSLIALGDCPVASGDGAVILQLRGALLGD